MTTRQYRTHQRSTKRAQHEAWTAIIIALLLVSLMAIKFKLNSNFAHDLYQHNLEVNNVNR